MPKTGENYNPLNDKRLLDDINNAFIKKFKTDKKYYIYDVNTNEICDVDNVSYDLFPDKHQNKIINIEKIINKHSQEKVKTALKGIKDIKEKNELFSSSRPSIAIKESINDVKALYDGNLIQLALEVTQQCNLRCKYCIYSGCYKNKRQHSDKYMNWDTAKLLIDQFLYNSHNTKSCYLSFYGGEPLLNYELIKQCTEYVKTKTPKFQFAIATNGLLLNKEVSDFLVNNGFVIRISLNGPEHIHDSYRININGDGSHSSIINNIEYIATNHKEYFNSGHISFNCVLTPPWKIKEIINYFIINYPNQIVDYQVVDLRNTSYFVDRYSKDDLYTELKNQFTSIKNEIYNHIKKGELVPHQYLMIILKDFTRIINRPKSRLSKIWMAGNVCWLGKHRLFVTAEGKYLSCEKVNDSFQIGNHHDGINHDIIYKYLSTIQKAFKDKCNKCWAIRLCAECVMQSVNNMHDISNNNTYLKQFCLKSREYWLQSLIKYMEILEFNPTALEFLERKGGDLVRNNI